jgi:hypothetical protein
MAIAACAAAMPALEPAGDGRTARCIRWREVG